MILKIEVAKGYYFGKNRFKIHILLNLPSIYLYTYVSANYLITHWISFTETTIATLERLYYCNGPFLYLLIHRSRNSVFFGSGVRAGAIKYQWKAHSDKYKYSTSINPLLSGVTKGHTHLNKPAAFSNLQNNF